MRLLALLTSLSQAHACPIAADVSCSSVYAALVSRIRCVGSACPKTLDPAQCMQHKLMRRALTWADDAGVPALDNQTGSIRWNASCTQLADVVALSLLGRLFVEQQTPDVVFFEFNTGSNTLQLRPLGCEFQKPLYTVVLLVVLSTLSFVLVAQHMRQHEALKVD
jgi:hypothetical protein